jgi:hypothetical protein
VVVVAVVLSALADALWATGTALSLRTHQGQHLNRSSRSSMPSRFLWSGGILPLYFAGAAFDDHHHYAARLAIAVTLGVAMFVATTIAPLLVHNARVNQPAR